MVFDKQRDRNETLDRFYNPNGVMNWGTTVSGSAKQFKTCYHPEPFLAGETIITPLGL